MFSQEKFCCWKILNSVFVSSFSSFFLSVSFQSLSLSLLVGFKLVIHKKLCWNIKINSTITKYWNIFYFVLYTFYKYICFHIKTYVFSYIYILNIIYYLYITCIYRITNIYIKCCDIYLNVELWQWRNSGEIQAMICIKYYHVFHACLSLSLSLSLSQHEMPFTLGAILVHLHFIIPLAPFTITIQWEVFFFYCNISFFFWFVFFMPGECLRTTST